MIESNMYINASPHSMWDSLPIPFTCNLFLSRSIILQPGNYVKNATILALVQWRNFMANSKLNGLCLANNKVIIHSNLNLKWDYLKETRKVVFRSWTIMEFFEGKTMKKGFVKSLPVAILFPLQKLYKSEILTPCKVRGMNCYVRWTVWKC